MYGKKRLDLLPLIKNASTPVIIILSRVVGGDIGCKEPWVWVGNQGCDIGLALHSGRFLGDPCWQIPHPSWPWVC